MINKKLVVIGASGHGKVVADIARLNGYKSIIFLDDDSQKKECFNCPVLGKIEEAVNFLGCDFIVAIGNNEIREKVQLYLLNLKIHFVTLIHPRAVVSDSVSVGIGCVIMANAVINPDTKIGNGVIVNTSSSIDHDCVVGDFSHVSVGTRIAGTSFIGNRVMVGAGATIINNIKIADDCIVGAGAVVVKDIKTKGVYVGVPAHQK